jgi:hypothetical protein
VIKLSKKANVIFIIVLFIYLSIHTISWEKNEHIVETKDKYNNTMEETKLYYIGDDLVPVKNVGANRVGSHFGMAQVFGVMVIVGIYLFLQRREIDGEPIPEHEYKEHLQEQLSIRSDIRKFKVYDETFLPKVEIDDSAGKEHKRYLFVEIKYKDDSPHEGETKLYGIAVNNYQKEVKEWLSMKYYPEGLSLRCHICGAFPDKKIITPTGYKELKENFDN